MGQTFQKKAWEFVVGETILTDDDARFRIVSRKRATEEGIGAYIELGVYREDTAEAGQTVEVLSVRFDPHVPLQGVSRYVAPPTSADKLQAIRDLLETVENGSTWWDWIESGLDGSLAEQLREVLS